MTDAHPVFTWRGGVPGYLHRDRWLPLIAGASDESDGGDDGAGGDGDSGDGSGDADGDADGAGGGDEVRDPQAKIKALESQIHRRANQVAKLKAEIEQLKTGHNGDKLRAARIEAAFLREVLGRPAGLDVETALDLANVRGYFDPITIAEGGEVAGSPKRLTA